MNLSDNPGEFKGEILSKTRFLESCIEKNKLGLFLQNDLPNPLPPKVAKTQNDAQCSKTLLEKKFACKSFSTKNILKDFFLYALKHLQKKSIKIRTITILRHILCFLRTKTLRFCAATPHQFFFIFITFVNISNLETQPYSFWTDFLTEWVQSTLHRFRIFLTSHSA